MWPSLWDGPLTLGWPAFGMALATVGWPTFWDGPRLRQGKAAMKAEASFQTLNSVVAGVPGGAYRLRDHPGQGVFPGLDPNRLAGAPRYDPLTRPKIDGAAMSDPGATSTDLAIRRRYAEG